MHRSIESLLSSLPKFSTLNPAGLVADLDQLLDANRAEVERLGHATEPPSWVGTIAPLEEAQDRVRRFWSPVGHLHGVADSPALREAYGECLSRLAAFQAELAQDSRLYQAYRTIRDGAEYLEMDDAQRKVVDNALRDFRLGGVELQGDARERFRSIVQELSTLCTRFEENVLDSTQAYKKQVTDEARLTGLPESVKAMCARTAAEDGVDGWVLTLDYPCYLPVMRHADDRGLREELYRAFVTRASDAGPDEGRFDNSAVVRDILTLRTEQAHLLGFSSYSELSLATKMADSPGDVLTFLRDLAQRSRSAAEAEYAELKTFAGAELEIDDFAAWDMAYSAEKLRQRDYEVSQEELRPYFPAPRVIAGMFAIVAKLFQIDVEAVDAVDVWHEDVTTYVIRDREGQILGLFYLDLYAREGKRGGAWMDECLVRRRGEGGLQLPAAYLTCNFTPPADGQPSQLTHDEVLTLFHEFGHGLHHMLTQVDYAAVSGINGVAWDAVELPSQFLEFWCWEREAVDLLSAHVDSGESLPDNLFQRLTAARNFHAALQMLRQVEFALFDFRLHEEDGATVDVQQIIDETRAEISVIATPHFNRFQYSFSHIFAGGYAAGYYSYKWAEVLAADAFSRFEEEGIFNAITGTDFRRHILERGGSREPRELFENFRGREPALEPLLRHSGLLET